MPPRNANKRTKNAELGQTAQEQSDLGLHYSFRHVCLENLDNWALLRENITSGFQTMSGTNLPTPSEVSLTCEISAFKTISNFTI